MTTIQVTLMPEVCFTFLPDSHLNVFSVSYNNSLALEIVMRLTFIAAGNVSFVDSCTYFLYRPALTLCMDF